MSFGSIILNKAAISHMKMKSTQAKKQHLIAVFFLLVNNECELLSLPSVFSYQMFSFEWKPD